MTLEILKCNKNDSERRKQWKRKWDEKCWDTERDGRHWFERERETCFFVWFSFPSHSLSVLFDVYFVHFTSSFSCCSTRREAWKKERERERHYKSCLNPSSLSCRFFPFFSVKVLLFACRVLLSQQEVWGASAISFLLYKRALRIKGLSRYIQNCSLSLPPVLLPFILITRTERTEEAKKRATVYLFPFLSLLSSHHCLSSFLFCLLWLCTFRAEGTLNASVETITRYQGKQTYQRTHSNFPCQSLFSLIWFHHPLGEIAQMTQSYYELKVWRFVTGNEDRKLFWAQGNDAGRIWPVIQQNKDTKV